MALVNITSSGLPINSHINLIEVEIVYYLGSCVKLSAKLSVGFTFKLKAACFHQLRLYYAIYTSKEILFSKIVTP